MACAPRGPSSPAWSACAWPRPSSVQASTHALVRQRLQMHEPLGLGSVASMVSESLIALMALLPCCLTLRVAGFGHALLWHPLFCDRQPYSLSLHGPPWCLCSSTKCILCLACPSHVDASIRCSTACLGAMSHNTQCTRMADRYFRQCCGAACLAASP